MGNGIKGPYQSSCTDLGERKNNKRTFNRRKDESRSSSEIQYVNFSITLQKGGSKKHVCVSHILSQRYFSIND